MEIEEVLVVLWFRFWGLWVRVVWGSGVVGGNCYCDGGTGAAEIWVGGVNGDFA